jgi:hypothetical protein
LAAEPDPNSQRLAAALADVSERIALLVREEIELAKAEVTQKASRLAKGIAIGLAAGVFVLAALAMALHGFAWLLWYVLPAGNATYFWGFFLLSFILLLLAALAGFLAYKAVRGGVAPTPTMAIEEAKLIRDTVKGGPEEQG